MTIHELVWAIPHSQLDIKNVNGSKVDGRAYHEFGKGTHPIQWYQTELYPSVYLKWGFCYACNQLRNKYVIGYDNEDNTAYVRDIVKNGQPVLEN